MLTFLIGLGILVVGGALYGKLCEKIFKPDDRETPAVRLNDGIDYVPMKKWKNSLIQLLNIAGTGPVLGPIQGILFGPIAFITIPLGCIIGGAFHDYMSGMISLRYNGEQMPSLVKRFLGKNTYVVYNIFVCILMLLVGAVFIYTPGDIFITQILGKSSGMTDSITWIVYGVIFAYYLIATVFPIDKIIGKVYPVFGAILILSAVGVFFGIFAKSYPLDEIWVTGVSNIHPQKLSFFPIFFVTVACGIVSGFHSTQSTMIARAVKNEKDGRMTFFNMMLVEGFIAMIWAAAAMGVMNLGLVGKDASAMSVCGTIASDLLGKVGSIVALLGVVVLAITSGDTALRSLRLIVADTFKLDQSKGRKRMALSAVIFVFVMAILVFAKMNPKGFDILWRYFAWSNQTISIFAFGLIAVYMIKRKQPFVMALVPGMFYTMVISSFILNAKIGFNLSMPLSYIIAGVFTIFYVAFIIYKSKKDTDTII